MITFRLTVRQFAACIQRCEETVRVEIRARNIEAEGPPYLIHPRELARYHVDQEMAVARLKEAGLWPSPQRCAA